MYILQCAPMIVNARAAIEAAINTAVTDADGTVSSGV